jgi:hypothetical protein
MTDQTADRAIEDAIEQAWRDRGVDMPEDWADLAFVAAVAVRALASVPTADVADLTHLPAARMGCPATAGDRCILPAEHPHHGEVAAPEGVDAADEQDGAEEWSPPGFIPAQAHLLILEQLTAAQAAIQRVRDYVAENGRVFVERSHTWVTTDGVLRALDDDTTEES